MRLLLSGFFLITLIGAGYSQSRKFHYGVYAELMHRNNLFSASYDPGRPNLQNKNRGGNAIGVVLAYDLSPAVTVRFSPGIANETDEFRWWVHDPFIPIIVTEERREQEYGFLKVPLHFLFRAGESKRLYGLLGATRYDVMELKTPEPAIALRTDDLTLDFGFGHDIKAGPIQITPELRYGFALQNSVDMGGSGIKHYRHRMMFTLLITR